MEYLEGVHLFTGAGKFDRLTGHLAQGQGGPASRVTIEFGQDEAGDPDPTVEFFGYADRLLSGRSIADQETFVRLD